MISFCLLSVELNYISIEFVNSNHIYFCSSCYTYLIPGTIIIVEHIGVVMKKINWGPNQQLTVEMHSAVVFSSDEVH